MGKYVAAEQAVFNVFDSPEWQAEGIRAVPLGFDGPVTETSYIRLSVIPNGASVNSGSISGLVMIEIFTAWGEGPRPSTIIADKLDEYLQHKSYTGIQLFKSSMAVFARDSSNPTLGRSIYSIPFSHFGV